MGMYNEVFKKCPHCSNGTGYLQIHQIVLGFGGFNLDDPNSLNRLSLDELSQLREAVTGGDFHCLGRWHPLFGREDNAGGCGGTFRFNASNEDEAKRRIIKDLCS